MVPDLKDFLVTDGRKALLLLQSCKAPWEFRNKKELYPSWKKISPSLLLATASWSMDFFFLWLRLPFRTVVERRALALKEDFSMCKALFRSGIPCKKQKCSLPSRQTDCSNKIGIVMGSRKVWILVSLPTKPKYLEQCLAPNRCSADAQWTKQDKY